MVGSTPGADGLAVEAEQEWAQKWAQEWEKIKGQLKRAEKKKAVEITAGGVSEEAEDEWKHDSRYCEYDCGRALEAL